MIYTMIDMVINYGFQYYRHIGGYFLHIGIFEMLFLPDIYFHEW